jgi:lipopolysaccharide/colanic/teichoic acid biosynthesis glycosyltransferase
MATMLTPRFERRLIVARRSITLVHPLHPSDRERPDRRLLNVAVAIVGLALALPLMLGIAVLIKLTSRGPVLFSQARIGVDRRALSRMGGNTRRRIDLGGKPFTMYKFRTMYVDDASTDVQVWAQLNDVRVTPIGRWLRRFRLDELPQFLNVLQGDMNIVGPRPEQPAIFVYLREQIEGYQRRQRVRPGITGWAQINQGYDRSIDDVRRKVSYDLEYIRRQSPRADLHIMLRTLPVMIGGHGAR